MERIRIIDSKKHVGEVVTIAGWIANKRSSGKIAFLQIRDGSAFFQGVVVKNEVGEEVFDLAKSLNQETSVIITGEIREDTRSKFGYEIGVQGIEVVGESHDYPITPKEHGTDFLMDHRHLWLRSSRQHAIMQIRNEMIRATYEFFNTRGFIKIDPPILTSSAPGRDDRIVPHGLLWRRSLSFSNRPVILRSQPRWLLEKSFHLTNIQSGKI